MKNKRSLRTGLLFTSLPLLLLPWANTWSLELTGRFSMLGTTAQATQGDLGYLTKDNILTADQQSLRLMLNESRENDEWLLHAKMLRRHLSDFTYSTTHSSQLFRYKNLSSDWLNETESNNSSYIGSDIDRLSYKHRYKNTTLTLGRQPIDWGSGRFWQPLNIFGAFSPIDLDTDYKPGIDAARLNWFPTDFSSLSTVYIFSPENNTAVDHKTSAAMHYQRQVGGMSQLALVAGSVIGNPVFGASFESSWNGMGWRMEGVSYHLNRTDENSLFWIAGLDYQFSNGTLLSAELYNNSRGAKSVIAMRQTPSLTDTFIKYGLQQHLSQNVLGLSFNKDISPLLNGGYTLLASPLKNDQGSVETSLLHQFNFRYSLSNESDLLFSLQFASGRGLNGATKTQSEFGHLPASMTLRLRFYF